VIVDSKPALFDEDKSADGKIVDATIPAAATGQLAATVRVQVGPVTLQGDRQCRYQ
jgi:hypothetical protein